MNTRPLILYHDQCADGFCACWVAHRKFGDGADYLPVQYGQDPPDVTGRSLVYILDFSYKKPVLEAMSQKAQAVYILDHHKTAEQDLRAIGHDPISGYLAGGNTLVAFFDLSNWSSY